MAAGPDRLQAPHMGRLLAWLRTVDAALDVTSDDSLEARVYALELRLRRLEDLQTSEEAGSDPTVGDPIKSIGE